MSESAIGFLLLVGISIAIAVCAHWLIRSYILASLAAAVVSSCLFQFGLYLRVGYLDPFFIMALGTSGIVAVVIAAAIGIPFYFRRKRKK